MPAWRRVVEQWRRTDPDRFEAWSERAAIREFDGGMAREDAERAAYEDVQRMVRR